MFPTSDVITGHQPQTAHQIKTVSRVYYDIFICKSFRNRFLSSKVCICFGLINIVFSAAAAAMTQIHPI